jgi:predicted dehydrogenase
MKFAILGADATTLGLAKVAVERADVEIAFLCELDQTTDPAAAELQRVVARSAQLLEAWEDLLDRQLVDAVIVARAADEERRCEQLRKFAQVGMPVLMSHPVVDSMLMYYELDMIRRDTDAIIMPVLPNRLHPAVSELMSLMDASSSAIGKIEQVAIERPMADRSKATVLTEFARDVDLLRHLCGELNQIGAMGTAGDEAVYGNLSVQMTGPENLLARWSVVPVETGMSSSARLTLTGSGGKATVGMPADGQVWSLSVTGQPGSRQFPEWNRWHAALAPFIRTIQNEPADPGIPDLLDAARSAELTATIGRSLARRRTIDLYFEDHSEENTFKGMMAAGGCLLLMLGIGVVLVAAVLDKAKVPGVWLWPWMLAAVFGVFLVMQLLTLVFRK